MSRNGDYTLQQEALNDFFYVNEYDYAVLKILGEAGRSNSHKQLMQSIMAIHTGETIANATRGCSDQERQAIGQVLLIKLAEDILNHYETIPVTKADGTRVSTQEELDDLKFTATYNRPGAEALGNLLSSLEIDDYLYRDGHLYAIESSVINTVEHRTYLEQLVDSLSIQNQVVIKHHITESETAYAGGRWGHAISDARNFLEAILREVAAAHHSKTKGTKISDDVFSRSVRVREYLESEGFIDGPEKEAIAKIYGLMSNTGSHPNIAQKDQARLMRSLALTLGQFILLQWQGYLKNNP